MKKNKTNYAYTAYVVEVKAPGSRRWTYYRGVNINDTVITTPEFSDSFRFHDRKTAELVAKSLTAIGAQTQIKEV